MTHLKDFTEDYDFRDIALMNEKPVIIRANDEADNEEYFVLDVTDTEGQPSSVAMTYEALVEMYCEIQDIIKEKLEKN